MENNSIKLFSLGLEELAMALGLINRPDLGRQLILSIYEGIGEEEIDHRLTSASHSLLARGLVAISEKGSPILENDLEKALFPLARFDYIVQLSRIREGKQISATIHVQKGKLFTSHSIQAGVVHVLELGQYKDLPDYLCDIFSAGAEEDKKSMEFEWMISSGVLGETLRGANDRSIVEVIKNAGVPLSDAKDLAADLAQQTERGTILRVQAGSELDVQTIPLAEKKMLMLLSGEKRNWLFKFDSALDSALGKVSVLNAGAFRKHLETFVL
jgi:hypothetical protein